MKKKTQATMLAKVLEYGTLRLIPEKEWQEKMMILDEKTKARNLILKTRGYLPYEFIANDGIGPIATCFQLTTNPFSLIDIIYNWIMEEETK